jgi:hypothetical protein
VTVLADVALHEAKLSAALITTTAIVASAKDRL